MTEGGSISGKGVNNASTNSLTIGMGCGTINSSMARFSLRTGQAEVILNAEGEAKTLSLVYFGEDKTLVSKPVGYRMIARSLCNPSRVNSHCYHSIERSYFPCNEDEVTALEAERRSWTFTRSRSSR
jgi:hypothetical protein